MKNWQKKQKKKKFDDAQIAEKKSFRRRLRKPKTFF